MHRVGMGLFMLLMTACLAFAANDLLWVDGTNVRYGDAEMVPASDVQITLSELPAGQGRISTLKDWGAAPRPARYRYQCAFALAGTGQEGKVIELWAARSYDGTLMDGGFATTDTALTNPIGHDRDNLMPIGQVVVDNTTANLVSVGSGLTPEIPYRWWSLIAWNTTSQAFSVKTTTPSYCIFTPTYLRVVP